MKEIKAYIRPDRGDAVITHLEAVGVKGMTVIDVSMIGSWANPEGSRISMEFCEKYCKVLKIELVCPDDAADIVVKTILEHAHSGQAGDGKIFITNVEDGVSIRTLRRGAESLA